MKTPKKFTWGYKNVKDFYLGVCNLVNKLMMLNFLTKTKLFNGFSVLLQPIKTWFY